MKKRIITLSVILILVVILVVGIGLTVRKYLSQTPTISFGQMEYERPDIRELETVTDRCMTLSKGDDVRDLMDEVYAFYELYSAFYTNYYLAYLRHCIDMSDFYWEREYDYCSQKSTRVDSSFDDLMHALADSPLRSQLETEDYFGEGYFDAYTGDSLWTDTFTDLMAQEEQLQSEYYDICAKAADTPPMSQAYYDTYGPQLAQLYVQMISLRQQIAQEAGYDSYPEFAYDHYFHRDYTPLQASSYIEDIRRELVPLYRETDFTTLWTEALQPCTTPQTFAYVEDMASAMDGVVWDAFRDMDKLDLYHIEYGKNKLDSSFEVYLPDYRAPFVFVSPTGTSADQLTFAHEFGHFCMDYASTGAAIGIDVAEIFSQGMEFLSLSYSEDSKGLADYKLSNSLCVFVEQAAYASFELQVYQLTGDQLTTENVEALFRQVGEDFGLDHWSFDSRSYVAIPHLFTSPMYVISYVVSNDAALQLYQMEQTQAGKGLQCYEQGLTTQQSDFLAFLEEAGLESPFAEDRITTVRKTFQALLEP